MYVVLITVVLFSLYKDCFIINITLTVHTCLCTLHVRSSRLLHYRSTEQITLLILFRKLYQFNNTVRLFVKDACTRPWTLLGLVFLFDDWFYKQNITNKLEIKLLCVARPWYHTCFCYLPILKKLHKQIILN